MPGCPRCFTLPTSPDGARIPLLKYEYDPLSQNTVIEQSSNSDSNANIPRLHTPLTTFRAIRLYRKEQSCFVALYIKEMPMGKVQYFVVDATYTVYNLWNIFDAHSGAKGKSSSRMLTLPTSESLFELNNDITVETELNLSRKTGLEMLSRYGFNKPGSSIVLLSFAHYNPSTAPTLIIQLLNQNTAVSPGNDIHISHNTESIPKDVSLDSLQMALLPVIKTQFSRQSS